MTRTGSNHAISAAVGWSAAPDPAEAGKKAADQALQRLTLHERQLAVVFGSAHLDQEALLQGVRAVLRDMPLVGGSCAGELVGEGPLRHSCVVLVLSSSTLLWSVGVGADVDRDPREAGHRAVRSALQGLPAGAPRLAFLTFGDGLVHGYAGTIRGIQEVLGLWSLIVGGLAADDGRRERTCQYHNDRVLTRAVVGVLFGGKGRIGAGIEHGFAPISKPRRITRAHANVLAELDHRPAASVYEEYFGPDVVARLRRTGPGREAFAYPLGIQPAGSTRWVLRNVVSFQDDGALSCNGDVREGAWLYLMIGSRELALEAAEAATRRALETVSAPAAVLILESASRRQLLGEHYTAMEIARIRRVAGLGVPIAGCYTAGEQGPLDADEPQRTDTAIQTGSVLALAFGS
jgi:hypothetical protein